MYNRLLSDSQSLPCTFEREMHRGYEQLLIAFGCHAELKDVMLSGVEAY
jgi:hypothetical protein